MFYQSNEKCPFFSNAIQYIRLYTVGFIYGVSCNTAYRNNMNFRKRGFTGFRARATQLLSATIVTCTLKFPIKRISRVVIKSINESMRAFGKSQPVLLRRSRISNYDFSCSAETRNPSEYPWHIPHRITATYIRSNFTSRRCVVACNFVRTINFSLAR